MVKILVLGDFHGKVHPNLKKIKEDYDIILCTGDFADTTKLRELEFKYWDYLKKGKTLEKIWGKKKYAKIIQLAIISMKSPLKFLESLNKPVYTIYGNSDFLSKDNKKFEKNCLDYLCKNLKITLIKTGYASAHGVTIAGFSGYRGPVTKKGLVKIDRKTEQEVKKTNLNWNIRLKTLFKEISCEEVIFLAHDVPKGIFDKVNNKSSPLNGKHVGDEYFTKYILKYKPKLFVCGHMHEYQGFKRLGRTLVINPGPAYEGKAAIIDYPNKIKFIK